MLQCLVVVVAAVVHVEAVLLVVAVAAIVCVEAQGRSQGRVPGVLEPSFWVMKMNIISRGKTGPPL